MSKQEMVSLQCDLCKWPAKVIAKDKVATSGWMIVGCQGYHLDRDFFDAHICPNCVKKIAAKLAKQKETQ